VSKCHRDDDGRVSGERRDLFTIVHSDNVHFSFLVDSESAPKPRSAIEKPRSWERLLGSIASISGGETKGVYCRHYSR
jgi:hypothetical protein